MKHVKQKKQSKASTGIKVNSKCASIYTNGSFGGRTRLIERRELFPRSQSLPATVATARHQRERQFLFGVQWERRGTHPYGPRTFRMGSR
jgi:hypothetical protein